MTTLHAGITQAAAKIWERNLIADLGATGPRGYNTPKAAPGLCKQFWYLKGNNKL